LWARPLAAPPESAPPGASALRSTPDRLSCFCRRFTRFSVRHIFFSCLDLRGEDVRLPPFHPLSVGFFMQGRLGRICDLKKRCGIGLSIFSFYDPNFLLALPSFFSMLISKRRPQKHPFCFFYSPFVFRRNPGSEPPPCAHGSARLFEDMIIDCRVSLF